FRLELNKESVFKSLLRQHERLMVEKSKATEEAWKHSDDCLHEMESVNDNIKTWMQRIDGHIDERIGEVKVRPFTFIPKICRIANFHHNHSINFTRMNYTQSPCARFNLHFRHPSTRG